MPVFYNNSPAFRLNTFHLFLILVSNYENVRSSDFDADQFGLNDVSVFKTGLNLLEVNSFVPLKCEVNDENISLVFFEKPNN